MDDATRPTILVIMGSTRAGRRCPQIAAWLLGIAAQAEGARFELVDLKDWPLPDDEPGIPAQGRYEQPRTRAWSAKIAAAAGFVIVTPQYNWGYPAPLKNAIDHVYAEWRGKPLAIATYGGHGGGKCAAQLLQIAEALKMKPVPTMPAMTLAHEIILGAPLEPERDLAAYGDDVRRAIDELVPALPAEAISSAQ